MRADQRTTSDIAMEQMSMGTILPPPQGTSLAVSNENGLPSSSHHSPVEMGPQTPQINYSSHVTPKTALRHIASHETDTNSLSKKGGSIFEKPLPPIGDAQRTEMSPVVQRSEKSVAENSINTFPARGSSLPPDKGKKREDSSSSVPQQPTNGSSPTIKAKSRRSSLTLTRRRLSQNDTNQAADGKLSSEFFLYDSMTFASIHVRSKFRGTEV